LTPPFINRKPPPLLCDKHRIAGAGVLSRGTTLQLYSSHRPSPAIL